jgi:chorismate mutase
MAPAVIDSLPLAGFPFKVSSPFIISGPCGVESEKQIHAIADALNGSAHLLRGGIWKPRTRPDSFHGIGNEGLKWLKEAGVKNSLPVTVEVANPAHVEAALKAGIDVLWIGARTTVNPFLIQEITHALKGVDIPVMVKNPVNPDIELWIGAFERLNLAGINQLIAIHRGFSSYENSSYRNAPNWQIPIELKRRFPQLTLVCDPSHIAGNRNLIFRISQYAMDLNYDGLMIETHNHPELALSDREQQITPSDLKFLLESLIIRNPEVDDVLFLNLLEDLRSRIDQLDEQLLQVMSERMGIARNIGQYKKENNMTVFQAERWNEILKSRMKWGEVKELNQEFVKKLYYLIHDESIMQQNKVMQSDNNMKKNLQEDVKK